MRKLMLVAIGLIMTGCASGSMNYSPGSEKSVQTERLVNENFEEYWDLYVERLSESFFVINNISKESRIINVSFSTDTPSEFIDCGETVRVAKHPSFGERTYRYSTADDSTYQWGVEGTNHLIQVNRDTSLEGRVNIYMAPRGEDTLLRVNAKYVWQVTSSGAYVTANQYIPQQTMSIDFSSKAAGTKTETAPDGSLSILKCSSKGVLERELLNLYI